MNVLNRRIEDDDRNAGRKRDSRHSRRLGFLVIAGLLLSFHVGPAPTVWAKVALVVESRASIYQQAAQGFQQGFANADEVKQIYLAKDGRLPEEELEALRRSPPRLVVAIGTQAARSAKEHFSGLPILYCLALHPIQNKLVGANIGGVALDIDFSQQFDNIQKVLPNVRRIGVVYDELASGQLVRRLQKVVKPSVQLVPVEARTPQEAARVIPQLLDRVDAFWLLWDPVIANPANFKLLVELSLKHKVALIAPARPFVEAGALMSVGTDYMKAGQQTGRMAQQVLRSEARPEDFQAEQPQEVVVTINGEVARRFGIKFPSDLRADILTPP